MDVTDENKIGLGKSGDFGGLGWIDVDGFASGLDESAGVEDWSDLHLSGRGGKGLGLREGGDGQAESHEQ
jgi:hypothetical protein